MNKDLISVILLVGGIIILAVGVAGDNDDGIGIGPMLMIAGIIIYFVKGKKK